MPYSDDDPDMVLAEGTTELFDLHCQADPLVRRLKDHTGHRDHPGWDFTEESPIQIVCSCGQALKVDPRPAP